MSLLLAVLAFIAVPSSARPLSDEETLNVTIATDFYTQIIALNPQAPPMTEVPAILAAGSMLSGEPPAKLIELYRDFRSHLPLSVDSSYRSSLLAAAAAIGEKSSSEIMALFSFFNTQDATSDAAATLTAATALSGKSMVEVRDLYLAIYEVNPPALGSAWFTLGSVKSGKSPKELFKLHGELRHEGAITASILAAAAAISGKSAEQIIAIRAAVSGSAPLTFAAAIYHGPNPILERKLQKYKRVLTQPVQPARRGQGELAEEAFRFDWHGAR